MIERLDIFGHCGGYDLGNDSVCNHNMAECVGWGKIEATESGFPLRVMRVARLEVKEIVY